MAKKKKEIIAPKNRRSSPRALNGVDLQFGGGQGQFLVPFRDKSLVMVSIRRSRDGYGASLEVLPSDAGMEDFDLEVVLDRHAIHERTFPVCNGQVLDLRHADDVVSLVVDLPPDKKTRVVVRPAARRPICHRISA